MVAEGQDMKALLLSEVTSTVSTSSLGADGTAKTQDGARETRWRMRCPILPQKISQQDCADAGLVVNMVAIYGTSGYVRKSSKLRGFLPGNPSHLTAHNTHTLVAENCWYSPSGDLRPWRWYKWGSTCLHSPCSARVPKASLPAHWCSFHTLRGFLASSVSSLADGLHFWPELAKEWGEKKESLFSFSPLDLVLRIKSHLRSPWPSSG